MFKQFIHSTFILRLAKQMIIKIDLTALLRKQKVKIKAKCFKRGNMSKLKKKNKQ